MNMAKENEFSLLWAIAGGIFCWFLCILLADTAILPGTIVNLPAIGLFLGFLAGGFKDKLNII